MNQEYIQLEEDTEIIERWYDEMMQVYEAFYLAGKMVLDIEIGSEE